MIPLNLPESYDWVDPKETSIVHECPWMVPEAVMFMNKRLKNDWKVLEVGSGGSTFFFARRCKKVLAIENFYPYYETIQQAIYKKNIQDSIELKFVPTAQLIDFLSSLSESYDVISIDHAVHKPSRSECLNAVLRLWTGNMLVMDNYAKKPAWPESWKISEMRFKEIYPTTNGCEFLNFNHDRWAGRGTRIIIKN